MCRSQGIPANFTFVSKLSRRLRTILAEVKVFPSNPDGGFSGGLIKPLRRKKIRNRLFQSELTEVTVRAVQSYDPEKVNLE